MYQPLSDSLYEHLLYPAFLTSTPFDTVLAGWIEIYRANQKWETDELCPENLHSVGLNKCLALETA